jgi:hypothetical protein
MFTAFQILTNPVGWLLSFLTFGVLLSIAGVGLGTAAYLLPATLRRIRVVLAIASVASFGVAGGYWKGSGDCEAKHRVADLQEQVRVLQKTLDINAKARAAGEAGISALKKQLSDFDKRKDDVLQKLPVPAKGQCDGISRGATRGVQSILNPLR